MKKVVRVVLACLMVLALSSCGLFEPRYSAKKMKAEYTGVKHTETTAPDEFELAYMNFALNLFKNSLTKDDKNDLISPLSAAYCLALIANGTDGETLAQIEDAFGADIETINKGLSAFMNRINECRDVDVKLANSIWIRESHAQFVRQDFLKLNAEWYKSDVFSAPFNESTLQDVNSWGNFHTKGMIPKIMDDFSSDSAFMLLINALCFDAQWAIKYEKKDIYPVKFTNYDKTSSMVEMMYSENEATFYSDGIMAVRKDYKGNKFSLSFILPYGENFDHIYDSSPNLDTDVYEFAQSLDAKTWISLFKSETGSIVLEMPEFTYDAELSLVTPFQKMGISEIFTNRADFSKMISELSEVSVSDIHHNTFIDVSRNGTRAAAITRGEIHEGGLSQCIRIDKPFIYAIMDNTTGLPLFMGLVSHL